MSAPLIACTHAGKFGDILWALPTVRAVADHFETKVDLIVPAEYASLEGLLDRQYYVRLRPDPDWTVQQTAPATPRTPPSVREVYDRIYHLGYRGWPELPLPKETEVCLHQQWKDADGPVPTIDLTRPWITGVNRLPPTDVCIGFTDEHFELKYGLACLLRQHPDLRIQEICAPKSRWQDEGDGKALALPWKYAAGQILTAQVFLGDCSALHVLAVAIGTPVVCMEPNPHRHHPIFWPLGDRGPQVTLVRGGDGEPTFDARHMYDAIREVRAREVRR